ncbi:MAG TPA: TolC family protein, partial [Planctomycetaceae bacterium]|nr:TolC family protein [Planctomycetaceae bacterium]
SEPQAIPPALDGDGKPPKLTLDYLSRLIEESHPILQRDRARIDSASGQALQAGLYPNPRWDTNNPEVFNGPNSLFNAGFMQDFVTMGKKRLDRAAALRGVQQSEFALVQDRYQLLTALRSQFYQTLAAQTRVDVLNRLVKITAASVKTQNERIIATVGDRPELLLLEIDYNKVLADLRNAEQVFAGEQKQLADIVGYPGLVQDKVIGSLTARPPDFDEEVLDQFVTSENAVIQIAKLDIDKNKLLLKRAEVEPYPNVTLGPAYQWGLAKGNEQYWLSVQFPIPVWDRNQGNIQSARANVRDSTETLGQVQLDLLRQVADAFSTYRGTLERAEKYKTEIIPDSMEALRLAKSGFDAGLFEFSAYLQAQRTVMETTQDYIDILEKLWTTAATLAGLLQIDKFP